MESWQLALLSFSCFIPSEISSAVNGESSNGSTPLIVCLVEELSYCVFSEWKSFEKASTQLFGEIELNVIRINIAF